MDESERIDKLARAIWEFYYPQGGSIIANYDQLGFNDKEFIRREARKIADVLSGHAEIIPVARQ